MNAHCLALLIHLQHLKRCDVKFCRLNERRFHECLEGPFQMAHLWRSICTFKPPGLLPCDVYIWVYVTSVCDVYILPLLGHSSCIFHMNVKHDLTTTAIICEKTRGGRGRYRNSDTPGDIALPAQVSQYSVSFVNNEEVLSTFVFVRKFQNSPCLFTSLSFLWTMFSICLTFYSGE